MVLESALNAPALLRTVPAVNAGVKPTGAQLPPPGPDVISNGSDGEPGAPDSGADHGINDVVVV